MAADRLNVLSICGSLRKGSYNAMVARALPGLAPTGMTIKPAPSFAEFPIYNADLQAVGFAPDVTALGKPSARPTASSSARSTTSRFPAA